MWVVTKALVDFPESDVFWLVKCFASGLIGGQIQIKVLDTLPCLFSFNTTFQLQTQNLNYTICKELVFNYHPQRSCKGYVFTGVYLSNGGVGGYPSMPCSRSLGSIPACLAAGLGGGGVCYPIMHCRCYPSMPCNRSPGGLLLGGSALGGLLQGSLLLGGLLHDRKKQMATVADGTHFTGMHSCWNYDLGVELVQQNTLKFQNKKCRAVLNSNYFPINFPKWIHWIQWLNIFVFKRV